MSEQTRRQIRTAVKYIFLAAAGIVLFKLVSTYAFAKRGYSAVGGEYFLLMLPLFYAMIASTAKSVRHELKDIFSDGTKQAGVKTKPRARPAKSQTPRSDHEKEVNHHAENMQEMRQNF